MQSVWKAAMNKAFKRAIMQAVAIGTLFIAHEFYEIYFDSNVDPEFCNDILSNAFPFPRGDGSCSVDVATVVSFFLMVSVVASAILLPVNLVFGALAAKLRQDRLDDPTNDEPE